MLLARHSQSVYTTMKNVPQTIFVIFSLLILSVHSWENKVIVDQELNVTNDCIHDSNNMNLLCATINSALRNLKSDSTVIYIRPGNYTLRNGEETDITGKQDVAIIGSGEDSIITCTEYTGLGVLYSVNIRIEYIVMKGCGKKYKLYISYTESCDVNIALYFNKNYNIRLDSVVIRDSKEISVYVEGDASDFIINNCSIVNGSVAESSQNSIVGGIVLNIYSWGSTVHLSNSSIINNGDGTQSHDVYCSPIGAVAGIVVIKSPDELIIDSCMITDNTRGLVVYDVSAAIHISNTVLFNQVNNIEVVLRKYYSIGRVYISIYGDTLSDFTIVTLDHFPALIFHCSANGCSFGNDYLNIFVGHESHDGSDFSLQINETNFNNCLAFPPIGICSNDREDNRGHCPPSYSHCFANYCTCSKGRNGTLCGQCADGYSVAINSPYMSCVPCNSSSVYKGWALLIALEFIPITVMVAIIAVLNVNLNQGSLSSYIFLCQMITIPFPSVGYPSWLVSVTEIYDHNQLLLFSLLPLSIWNIGFIYYPSNFFVDLLDYPLQYNPVSICVSQSTTSLAYHIFWYIISFYPLVLALLIYCVIVMYDKGYMCVVCVVRPIHRLLARFWRLFDIQPSLSHTAASLYTLCFTQLAATSLKILHPIIYTDKESHNHSARFFYDGSQSYFSGVHGFAGTVAILVLVGLFITVAYLLLHPFRLFQWCFGKLKFKKDLIISVTDVFNGPFKDGSSENSWDYRYFAGMHFAIQLVVMTFYYIPLELMQVTGSLKMTVCSLYLLAILIFRPYKRNIHNFSEVLLFVLLTGLSVYPALGFDLSDLDSVFVIIILPIFGFIIIVLVIPYCLIWMIRKCCHCCKYIKDNYTKHNNVPLEDLHEKLITNSEDCAVDNVMFADRLMNPERYNSVKARGINTAEESDYD